MADRVRFGLLSTARIGLGAHVRAAKASGKADIVAIASRDSDRATAAAREHDIPLAFASYEEMLASSEIDAVINTLPNSMHHEWTIAAARAGKHILCEKPLAANVREAREMAAAAAAQKVVLVEAFTPRWNPQLRLARQLVADGALGTVTALSSALTFPLQRPGDVRLDTALAGGALLDAGCYAVDACRFMMGEEPTRASGFAHRAQPDGVDLTFVGLLLFASGAVAHILASFEQPAAKPIRVHGSQQTLTVEDSFGESASVGLVPVAAGGNVETHRLAGPDRFLVQIDEFADCVSTGKQPEFPATDGIRNMAAIDALFASERTGNTVDVEQI